MARVVETRDDFNQFWAQYPRREARLDALKAWIKLDPSSELCAQIAAALEWQTRQHDWQKENGQYVPLPATWIRGRRWEDEPRRVTDRRQHERHTVITLAWLDECQRLHGGACGLSKSAHDARMASESWT